MKKPRTGGVFRSHRRACVRVRPAARTASMSRRAVAVVIVRLPVIVIVPFAVAAELLVKEKLPVPVLGVRLVMVRLGIVPWSTNVSASVPGSFGEPSPNAFGVAVAAGARRAERDCPAFPPGGCVSSMKKHPVVALAVYVPPPRALPLYELTVYSPKYSVTMTGVGVGAGVGVAVGFGVAVGRGVGVGVAVGAGVGVAGP